MDKQITFEDFLQECLEQGFHEIYLTGISFTRRVPTDRTMTDFKDEESCS